MKYTIKDFNKEFNNDDACLDYIFKQRFGRLEDFDKYYRVTGRKCYAHSLTGNQIHPLAGTVFHKSSTSLLSWFFAMFLFSQSKNGVSAKELQRQLGVTYKCAYRMGQQIRKLMSQDGGMLSGTVEADETYIGGKERNKHKSKRTEGTQGRSVQTKTPVIGLVEREGNLVTSVEMNVRAETVIPMIRNNVEVGSQLMTDEYNVYRSIVEQGFDHKFVSHGQGEYVSGDCHTNTIEGFWSQLKRSISGTYGHVSRQKLQVYLDEFSFRYNLRESSVHVFRELLGKVL